MNRALQYNKTNKSSMRNHNFGMSVKPPVIRHRGKVSSAHSVCFSFVLECGQNKGENIRGSFHMKSTSSVAENFMRVHDSIKPPVWSAWSPNLSESKDSLARWAAVDRPSSLHAPSQPPSRQTGFRQIWQLRGGPNLLA